jgi:hypothetical protein
LAWLCQDTWPFCILLPQHDHTFVVSSRLQVTSKLFLINVLHFAAIALPS